MNNKRETLMHSITGASVENQIGLITNSQQISTVEVFDWMFQSTQDVIVTCLDDQVIYLVVGWNEETGECEAYPIIKNEGGGKQYRISNVRQWDHLMSDVYFNVNLVAPEVATAL
jgi:hypothetical protein